VRVLAIIHGENAGPGIFEEETLAAGHTLDVTSFAYGERPRDSFDALMVFGGAMNVHEVHGNPWIEEEREFIAGVLEDGIPTLGVCLGGQLVASVAGAEVARVSTPEIGWHDVTLMPEAADDPVLGGLPLLFKTYQWHSYGFSLPAGAIALARSPICLQAYRLGDTTWGTQFHAEVTEEICNSWIDEFHTDPDAVAQGFDPEVARADVAAHIAQWNELGRRLVSGFLAVAGERAEALAA
jgi:GMP synthase (glutamine-hydrolysing)